MTKKAPDKPITEPLLSLEEACFALSEHLPEAIQQFFEEMETTEGVPRHEMIVGYIMRHHELGELSYRPTEGAMLALGPSAQPLVQGRRQGEPVESICEWCNKPFTPTVVRQRFCPDPTEPTGEPSCGRQASLKQLRDEAKARKDFRYEKNRIPDHIARQRAEMEQLHG